MAPAICDECEIPEGLVFCTGCHAYFCGRCWNKRRAHREGLPGPGGIPHEANDPIIADLVEQCMAEPTNDSEQEKQHQDDEDTTWFGLDRDASGDPVLAEYRRYVAIMLESAVEPGISRYPALVSFIGQTAAGKSSLIRLLIDPKSNTNSDGNSSVAAPIVGRSASEVPTSADVHLYADPRTLETNRPILYADCEGFEGGERDPIALKQTTGVSNQTFGRGKTQPTSTSSSGAFQKLARGTKRALKWARRDNPDHDKTSKRGYAVAQMYPRILYAFSDVVVYVLTNPRTLEDVVEKLLDWADANYTKSTNLPSKPHAIIALNKSEHTTTEEQWKTRFATANLLSTDIRANNTFKKYATKWRNAQVQIRDTSDLLRCYYSSVTVVRLPQKSRAQLMHEQCGVLYKAIFKCCEESMETKKERRMLPDADEFGLYISLAFDHFSESLELPFDYVEASLKHQPPPVSLADNIINFARMIANQDPQLQIAQLFTKLAPMVASCLMLDSARKQRMGQAIDWFTYETLGMNIPPQSRSHQDRTARGSASSYQDLCRSVIERYLEDYVSCEFQVPDSMRWNTRHPCTQRKKAHGDIHRAKGTMGSTIEYMGPFQTSFNPDRFAWEDLILGSMSSLDDEVCRIEGETPRSSHIQKHQRTLDKFYEEFNTDTLLSNSICLCCLTNPPEHHLRCGHILCTDCAMDLGQLGDQSQILMSKCPLHIGEFDATIIPVPPPFSGLRVLTLDGGGIRGVVELCIMQAIEKTLGIPLRHFFDLVVGTSTGGIIALAFGDQMWDLDECTDKFRSLVAKAFTPRKGQSIHVIKHVQLLMKKSKYETRALMSALQEAFKQDIVLFRPQANENLNRLKVAVTATSSSGSKPYVLSNYNTKNSGGQDSSLFYVRYRPDSPGDEIKVWEAARSTSAAPGYFKPFARKVASDSIAAFPELMDGGILHNNPVEIALEEVRRLAESSRQSSIPDILVSIGTGLQLDEPPLDNSLSNGKRPVKASWIKNLFTIVRNQIKLNLDTERRWFHVVKENPRLKERMHRINPNLGEDPPEMDNVSQAEPLYRKVEEWVSNTSAKMYIAKIARGLIASSFYFERDGVAVMGPASSISLPGLIRCRLSGDPKAIKRLGRLLSAAHHPGASFVVENIPSTRTEKKFMIAYEDMIDHGVWKDMKVLVTIPGEDTNTTISLEAPGLCDIRTARPTEESRSTISGFPRNLMRNDFLSGLHHRRSI